MFFFITIVLECNSTNVANRNEKETKPDFHFLKVTIKMEKVTVFTSLKFANIMQFRLKFKQ